MVAFPEFKNDHKGKNKSLRNVKLSQFLKGGRIFQHVIKTFGTSSEGAFYN